MIDQKLVLDPFLCYQQQRYEITDAAMSLPVSLWQSEYQILSQRLIQWRLELTLSRLASQDKLKEMIEKECCSALKVMQGHFKRELRKRGVNDANYFVLIVKIKLQSGDAVKTPDFGADYFLESLIVDTDDDAQLLQVFSAASWQTIAETLISPTDILNFLAYHHQQLSDDIDRGAASFTTEVELLQQFLNHETLLAPAIAIDNALIQAGAQEVPTATLVAMRLAQRENVQRWSEYWQKLWQSARLWSQLVTQLMSSAKFTSEAIKKWQGVLLSESLFSRHELITALLAHQSRSVELKASGYVIHQHSFSNLGRHYVLIFYGTNPQSLNSKAVISNNLSSIALDVASRLPLSELQEVVVVGFEFLKKHEDTWIDMDVFIQPVQGMTPKERQLTRQLQKLQQNASTKPAPKFDIKQASLKVNMTMSNRNRKF